MIILAVVIIIGVIVVVALGGVPSLGGGTGDRASQTQLVTANIGITSHAVSNASTQLTLRNNQGKRIRITEVMFDEESIGCTMLPLILLAGESNQITCNKSGTPGSRYEFEIRVSYVIDGVTYTPIIGSISGSVGESGVTYLPDETPPIEEPEPQQLVVTLNNCNNNECDAGSSDSYQLSWTTNLNSNCQLNSYSDSGTIFQYLFSLTQEQTLFTINCQDTTNSSNSASISGIITTTYLFSNPIAGLHQGLVGYWPLDEDLLDYSGNENHGVCTSCPTLDNGIVNGAYNFSNNVVKIEGSISYDFYSFSFWVYREGIGGNNPRILSPSDNHWILWNRHYNNVGFHGTNLTIAPSPELDTWEHYVFIYNVTNSLGDIYKNGILVVQNGFAVRNKPTGNYWAIGRHESLTHLDDHWVGLIDEIAIWNRSLSSEEIQQLYNNGNGLSLKLN